MKPDPIGPNVELLEQLAALVARLHDDQYVHVESRLTGASIGAHVRHILDHYRLFLAGVPAGAVDYDARERDTPVERERAAALAQAASLASGLRGVPSEAFARPLHVHQQGAYEAGRFETCDSRVDRELLFLQSHTVHHQAIIGLLAKLQGVEPPEHFGVAPSTVAYLEARAAGHLAAR